MISLEDHLDRILATVSAGPVVQAPVAAADRLVLAQAVHSQLDLPVFTNSSMDGYAVRSVDLAAAAGHPVRLSVQGDIPAGDTQPRRLTPQACWRIMTGAPLPEGADAVVPVEQTDAGTEQVLISTAPAAGQFVRERGEDLRAGDAVVPAGTLLCAHHLAAIIGAGVSSVAVHPRPRVAVVTTGDEVVPAGTPLQHGQIHDTNGPMLAALIRAAGAQVSQRVHVRDADDLAAVVRRLAAQADAVVTSGGISAGAFEPVKQAYATGEAVRFDAVAMQPGKPQGFGVVTERAVPLFALPGNPVSTLVSFQVFVVPALRRLAGRVDPPVILEAVVDEGWESPADRVQLMRVRLRRRDGHLVAQRSGAAGSHVLGGLAAASALAYVPIGVSQVRGGDRLQVRPLPGEPLPQE